DTLTRARAGQVRGVEDPLGRSRRRREFEAGREPVPVEGIGGRRPPRVPADVDERGAGHRTGEVVPQHTAQQGERAAETPPEQGDTARLHTPPRGGLGTRLHVLPERGRPRLPGAPGVQGTVAGGTAVVDAQYGDPRV